MSDDTNYFDSAEPLHHEVFFRAMPWREWIASGSMEERVTWSDEFNAVALDEDERRVVAGFTRRIYVLCVSGLWCSDSMRTGAALARIAEAAPAVDLRFVARDFSSALMDRHRSAGGARVPVTLVLSEDFYSVDVIGDRSLAHYRSLAVRMLGTGAPPAREAPVAGGDVTRATVRELVDRLERAHLLLRLAPSLRRRHGD